MQRRSPRLTTVRIVATLVAGSALWLVACSVAVARFGPIIGGCVAMWSGSSMVMIAVFAAECRSRSVPDREARRPVAEVPRVAA